MRTMVAPVAVRAQSCAEIMRPQVADVMLMRTAQENIEPAERAKLRAAAEGTISRAVTSKTPTAETQSMTLNDKSAEKMY